MTNKQWIRRVLAHDDGVPVPYNLMLSPSPRRLLQEHYRTDDLEGHLDLPIRMTGPQTIKPLYASPHEFGSMATDEFGVVWATNEIDRGAPVGPCLTKPDLSDYTFPAHSVGHLPCPTDGMAAEYRFEHFDAWCRQNARHYTIVWIGDLWERATFMCGMEILFDRYCFDGVALSDDYGTQKSLLVSPADWRRFVKPHLAEIFAKARAAGRAVFLHSCGNVHAVTADLIEIGLDILHPIQPEAMDVFELKRAFGDHLTFCGGLGTQALLPGATPQRVAEEVHRLEETMGRGGGYVLEPGITIQADVPLQNVLAVIDAMRA